MAQILKDNRSDNRGGKRENAGRKKGDKKQVGFRVTDTEEILLRDFLKKIRE